MVVRARRASKAVNQDSPLRATRSRACDPSPEWRTKLTPQLTRRLLANLKSPSRERLAAALSAYVWPRVSCGVRAQGRGELSRQRGWLPRSTARLVYQ